MKKATLGRAAAFFLPLLCTMQFSSAIPALVLASSLVVGSELISAGWQSSGQTAEQLGLYRESLFWLPPEGNSVSVQNLPIEEQQVGYLTYDRGRRLAILDRTEPRGMEVLYLEYDGRSPRFFFDLFNHPPERCMASTGAVVTARAADELVQVDGQTALLQTLLVSAPDSGDTRHIFKLVWIHPDHPIEYGSAIHLKRLQAALATIPPPPARLVMGGLHGFDSTESARAYFAAHVLERLRLMEL